MTDLTLYKMMQARISHLATRQGVIAANVANANTPNYKAQDVEKPNFHNMVKQGISPQQTHAGHMALSGSTNSQHKIGDDLSAFETTPDGNSVSLEDQMVKMNQTSLDYSTTTSLYKKMNEMMRLATATNGG